MTIQNEQGRTMLEMLGVIAIIGIITYGAIAGISYGMKTYKINQTYNDIQDIIQGVEDLYSWSRGGYPTGGDIIDAILNNDIFPDGEGTGCPGGLRCLAGQLGPIWISNDYLGGGNTPKHPSGSTFTVYVQVSDEISLERLDSMDWDTINIDHDMQEGSSILVFSPNAG